MEFRKEKIGSCDLIFENGDITKAKNQAIVNAANSMLAGGGGVDGAIHRAGGPEIMAQCRKIGHCPKGQAVVTTAGNLASEIVIHTVGPIYKAKPEDPEILASCYRNSLTKAMENDCKTVAFPSISTGVYGYPLDLAAEVSLKAVHDFLNQYPDFFSEIRFVLFGETAFDAYSKAFDRSIP